MKTWYRAVCFAHKETVDLFVNDPSTTAHYLAEKDNEIKAWLSKHYGCRLELVGDHDGDRIWDAGCWDPIKRLPPSADPEKRKAQ